MIKISIVTVTYNAVTTLEKTILSVLNQTYKNIEYIIIDGSSTDGTVNIIKKYTNRLAFWISEPDKGIYDAMNKSLKIATGDFLIFMGADDYFVNNNVIENVVSKIHDKNIVYYGDVLFRQINLKYKGEFNKYKLALNNICHQSIFYPQRIYTKYNYETKYRLCADYVYNIKLWSKYKFRYLNELITNYDMTGVSSTNIDKELYKDKPLLIVKNLGIVALLIIYLYSFYKKIRELL